MSKSRLEAFSDGVIAIIITIMVLELHVPEGTGWHSLLELVPNFLTYVLSFIYLAIYWNNHHYMIHAATRVTAGVLWANLHLLFWLSLIPFATGWMGRHHLEPVPSATYGTVLFMAGCAYWILEQQVMAAAGPHSGIAQALGTDTKGLISIALGAVAIAFAFVNQWVSDAIYVTVAMIWLVPDRRLEPS